jgi:hypothetical protein
MKEELKTKMAEIVSKLQHGDKIKAIEEIPISEPTLNKYLKGDIVKFDVADKIITYFENKYK